MSSVQAETFEEFLSAEVPDADRPWMERQQLTLYNGASGKAYTGNLVFGAIILALCHDTLTPTLFATILAIASLITITRPAALWQRIGVSTVLGPVSCHAILAGLGWGGLIGGLVARDAIHDVGPLGVIAAGLIMLGAMSFAFVPRAANIFIVLCSSFCVAGFAIGGGVTNYEIAALLAFFGLLSVTVCRFTFANFASRVLRERDLKRSADTVKLLLNDFEQQASDWLWETSATGSLINMTPRAAEAAARPTAELEAMQTIDLFEPGHDRDVLASLFKRREPFRDVVVPLQIHNERRWWSVSGRPALDVDGVFIGYRGAVSDITDAKRAEAQIAHMASYDGLTDLPNRMLFSETLSRALVRRRDDAMVAVLYLDIDNFKAINDMMGHGVGDQVLKAMAGRLETCIGLNDVVSRQGGDEFAVLLSDIASRDEAIVIAERIITAASEPILVDGQQVNSGTSIGIAFAPDDATAAADLIKNADLALYHSKENGRGRHSVFEIGMHEAMQAKRQMEVDLRLAIGRNELELYYQPLINLESGEATGYEALLRWNHPENGLIMPSVFIPVAEESGLIVPLGDWVIRNALMEVRRWPERLSVSVNLSPAQLRSTNLVPTVLNALGAAGIAANRLEFEITESVLMQDTEANLAVLHQLRAVGVHIALDDFGTGYSSLNYLRSFPFDKIKIDRCFVDEVDSRDDSRAIVRAVTGLATTLGMVTTAEGVEREDQLEELRREGCTEVQGYYFSRPLPASFVKERDTDLQAGDGANLSAMSQRPKKAAATPARRSA